MTSHGLPGSSWESFSLLAASAEKQVFYICIDIYPVQGFSC